MTNAEVIEIVEELNTEVFHDTGDTQLAFAAIFDGNTAAVEFLGLCIWRDNEDEREYLEEKDNHEPLAGFIRRRACQWIRRLHPLHERWHNKLDGIVDPP